MKINKSWHLKNPMPKKATLAQELQWHVDHARECAWCPVRDRRSSVSGWRLLAAVSVSSTIVRYFKTENKRLQLFRPSRPHRYGTFLAVNNYLRRSWLEKKKYPVGPPEE